MAHSSFFIFLNNLFLLRLTLQLILFFCKFLVHSLGPCILILFLFDCHDYHFKCRQQYYGGLLHVLFLAHSLLFVVVLLLMISRWQRRSTARKEDIKYATSLSNIISFVEKNCLDYYCFHDIPRLYQPCFIMFDFLHYVEIK